MEIETYDNIPIEASLEAGTEAACERTNDEVERRQAKNFVDFTQWNSFLDHMLEFMQYKPSTSSMSLDQMPLDCGMYAQSRLSIQGSDGDSLNLEDLGILLETLSSGSSSTDEKNSDTSSDSQSLKFCIDEKRLSQLIQENGHTDMFIAAQNRLKRSKSDVTKHGNSKQKRNSKQKGDVCEKKCCKSGSKSPEKLHFRNRSKSECRQCDKYSIPGVPTCFRLKPKEAAPRYRICVSSISMIFYLFGRLF
jgi:hypothetical protein